MRGTNGPMDIITRAELDDTVKHLPTKNDLSVFMSDVKVMIKENLDDLKVDLFAQIEEKVTRSHKVLQLEAAKKSDLQDIKLEILATTRRDINDAVAPLATKTGMDTRFSKIDASHEAINKSHEAIHKSHEAIHKSHEAIHKSHEEINKSHKEINKSIKDLKHFVMEGMGTLENRLRDQEASS